jgi:acyl carrier protein
MDRKERLLEELTKIFRKELENDNLVLNYTSSAKTVEKWDSVNNLMIIASIEEKYKIEFSIDFIFKAENVGDLCDYILDNSAEVS